MPPWQQILWILLAIALLFYLWPGAKAAMVRSKEVENPDWKSAILAIGAVVLFVALLIMMVKS